MTKVLGETHEALRIAEELQVTSAEGGRISFLLGTTLSQIIQSQVVSF